MRKWCLFSLLFIQACSRANQGLSSLISGDLNIEGMTELYVGMEQREVLQILRQPYRCESLQMDDDIYDIWFYVAHPTVLGQSRMVPFNLTPLAFKNGVLLGWGYRYYHDFLDKASNKKKPLLSPPSSTPASAQETAAKEEEKEEEEEPPPDEEGREMLQDDAEDDFDLW